MRTTTKHIESLIKQLNELTHNPTETNYLLTTNQGRKLCWNVGNYHLISAYGGYNLAQVVNNDGGITEPIYGGYVSKRELYNKLTAYTNGVRVGIKVFCIQNNLKQSEVNNG
tara:strand:+ start:1400 stop:1735 length:336 start_codon:yes stop_codon:yes gene_type:complete